MDLIGLIVLDLMKQIFEVGGLNSKSFLRQHASWMMFHFEGKVLD